MQALHVRQQNVARVEVVNRYVEETLNLVSMEVHRNKAVNSGDTKQVGHELGADAYPRFVLAVLTCPAEVRDYSDDVTRRSPLGCIYHKQQLHEVVGVGKGALHKENITSANRLLVGNGKFAVRKFGNEQVT